VNGSRTSTLGALPGLLGSGTDDDVEVEVSASSDFSTSSPGIAPRETTGAERGSCRGEA
jgi:hypothetical protein